MGRKIIDLTGKDFGMFHVVKQSKEKYITESGHSLVQWDCVDKEGNEYKLLAQYLKTCPTEYNPYNKKGHTESKYQNNKNTWVQQKVNSWKENNNDGINHQRKKYDLIGQVFGDWEVLEEGEPYQNKCNKYTRRTWRCVCHHILNDGTECGKVEDVIEANLVRGKSSCCKDCAKLISQKRIEIGQIYGKLKVIEKITKNPTLTDGQCEWLCECQCVLKTKVIRFRCVLLSSSSVGKACHQFGCNANEVITDENGNILKRKCKICGEMKDVSCFRSLQQARKNPICLECNPRHPVIPMTPEEKSPHERYKFYQNRAKSKNCELEFTEEEFDKFTKQPCFYCGGYSISKQYQDQFCGIDRVDSNKGYSKDNCVPCCFSCNVMKMGLDVYDFLDKVELISKNLDNIKKALKK